jgi:hypothetical protein
MKINLYILFGILMTLFACEDDNFETAGVEEQEAIVYNEAIIAKPVADEFGFAVITNNGEGINLIRIDDAGNKSYLTSLSSEYSTNFSVASSFDSDLITTSQGYYILSDNSSDSTLLVIKTDKEGNTQWFNELDLKGNDVSFSYLAASPTDEGGIKIITQRRSNDLFLRIIELGNMGGLAATPLAKNLGNNILMNIIPTIFNEGYALAVRQQIQGGIDNSFLLLDNNLDTAKVIPLTSGELQIYNMLVDEINNFLLVGFKNDRGTFSAETFTIFNGKDEAEQESSLFTGSKISYFQDALPIDDGYLFVGNLSSPNNINWNAIYDIDESDLLWDKVTFSESNEFDGVFFSDSPTIGGAVKLRDDGGILILGSILSFGLYPNTILIKTDTQGNFN